MKHVYSTALEELVYSKDFDSVCSVADTTWFGATDVGEKLNELTGLRAPYVWCHIHGQNVAILFQCSEPIAIQRVRAAEDRKVELCDRM